MQGVIGDYGVAGTNDGGEWMVNSCMQYEMTVCNTFFKKRNVQKYTRVREIRGEIVETALMDYMCISGKPKSRVTDLNVLRAVGDVQSSHHVVIYKVLCLFGFSLTLTDRAFLRGVYPKIDKLGRVIVKLGWSPRHSLWNVRGLGKVEGL